jgi:versiconal hemiacetal acetate esterase
VSVAYSLAPQNLFPAALDDSFTALKWTFANAASLGAAPEVAWLTGASAGANLALGAALKAIDAGLGDKLKGIVALVPPTVHPSAVPEDLKPKYTSYTVHDKDTVNSYGGMLSFYGWCSILGSHRQLLIVKDTYAAPPDDIYTSPLLHPKLAKLPRTYLNACEMDTLRDDAVLFKEAIEKAG